MQKVLYLYCRVYDIRMSMCVTYALNSKLNTFSERKCNGNTFSIGFGMGFLHRQRSTVEVLRFPWQLI